MYMIGYEVGERHHQTIILSGHQQRKFELYTKFVGRKTFGRKLKLRELVRLRKIRC